MPSSVDESRFRSEALRNPYPVHVQLNRYFGFTPLPKRREDLQADSLGLAPRSLLRRMSICIGASEIRNGFFCRLESVSVRLEEESFLCCSDQYLALVGNEIANCHHILFHFRAEIHFLINFLRQGFLCLVPTSQQILIPRRTLRTLNCAVVRQGSSQWAFGDRYTD